MANESPSSRRAWIEIRIRSSGFAKNGVALLAEGVDRNLMNGDVFAAVQCRPPRGGRG